MNPTPATPQPARRPIELDDLFRLKAIAGARFSPDGRTIVYTLTRIDVEKDKPFNSLWLYRLETGEARPLTHSAGSEWGAAWSPDGKQIAFLSDRDGKPQVYAIPVDGGEAVQLTDLQQPIGGGPAWSPDGTMIAFTAGPKLDPPPNPKKPYRLDRSVYRFDGVGYLDPVVQDIYVISSSGERAEPRQLTHDRFSNSDPQWSPDGKRILFLAQADPDSFDPSCRALKTVDLEGKVEILHSGWGGYETAGWLPNGKGIVFTGQVDGLPIGSKNDLWVYDMGKKKLANLTQDFKYGVGGGLRSDMPVSLDTRPRLSADGKTAFVQVHQGGCLHIYAVALGVGGSETQPLPLVTGERAAMLLDASTERLLFLESNHLLPGELCVSALDGSSEKRLTNINGEWTDGLELARVEHLLFPGVDGTQVEGWALLPAGDGPHPTVLYIHGGPHSAFGNIFNFDFLFLPARGYTCLLINHRASTGYGDAFSTAIKGDWGNLDYQDLMAGVDFAIARGFSDPDKLGCTGISGGGNLSCWIVGHTDRFKAAMPENPVSNWLSFYGTSDIGVWFGVEELGGHPHEIPEIYRKCSPVTYAHNCKTPTLMVQGENDYRCPAGQSEEFYTILKANGCVAEMLRLPNSFHGGAMSGALAMRRAHREALLEWMDRYVLGKTE